MKIPECITSEEGKALAEMILSLQQSMQKSCYAGYEAAGRVFNVSHSTLRRWHAKGLLPVNNELPGGPWISHNDIVKAVEAQRKFKDDYVNPLLRAS